MTREVPLAQDPVRQVYPDMPPLAEDAPVIGLDHPALKHLAGRALDDAGRQCEVAVPRTPHGRCRNRATAVRLEDGFSDVVCDDHADAAVARSALVVWS